VSLRILFVEKDITTADLLVPGLERKDYQVQVARTQRQALGRIRSKRPDLLIMDVKSFASSGYRISEAVRSRLEGVPTILLLPKGHATAGSTAEEYMVPPFTSRKLLYRVNRVAEGIISREMRAGPLALDPDTRMLRKGDTTVHLRPKEAGLLILFLHNQGKVLSRQAIMKEVWETEYFDDTRTLSVHIRWLRLKIEDEPSSPRFLRTVRGVGYRFGIPEPDD